MVDTERIVRRVHVLRECCSREITGYARAVKMFKTLFAIDAIIAAMVIYFFFAGLADGSVSPFNMTLWMGILAGLALVLVGSRMLNTNGHGAAANVLLSTLACPGVFYGLFILMVVILQPNWH